MLRAVKTNELQNEKKTKQEDITIGDDENNSSREGLHQPLHIATIIVCRLWPLATSSFDVASRVLLTVCHCQPTQLIIGFGKTLI